MDKLKRIIIKPKMEGSNESLKSDIALAGRLPIISNKCSTVASDNEGPHRITRSTARTHVSDSGENTKITQPARVVILKSSQAPKPNSNGSSPSSNGGQAPSRTIVLQTPRSSAATQAQQEMSQSQTITLASLDNPTNQAQPVSSLGTTQIILPSSDSNGNAQSVAESVGHTITVTVTDPEIRHGEGGIYPAGLQSGTYTVYGDNSYSPYYPPSSYGQSLHSPGSGAATPGATYIISPGGSVQTSQQSPNTIDDDGAQHLSHTTRASPATIQWLLQNYETAEGVSLPRCTLYNHYLRHCAENKLDPVNAASFGKLIRSVFLGLRTRRLGTRGNSKYHYYGIRIKPDSPLNRISDDAIPMAMRQQPSHPNRRAKPMTTRLEFVQQNNQQSAPVSSSTNANCSYNTRSNVSTPTTPGARDSSAVTYEPTAAQSVTGPAANASGQPESHKTYLGQGYVPEITAPAPDYLQRTLEPLGLNVQQVIKLFRSYRQHCEDILDCIRKLQFQDVEHCWSNFWQPDDDDADNDEEEDSLQSSNGGPTRSGLSQMQLFSLCTVPEIQQYIEQMDFRFYQVLVDVLIPNVLKPIPSSLTQAIRNFAKGLETGLKMAMQGAPEGMQKLKLNAVNSLAQTLRRYTSLNHLAQAARAVLQNPGQITQMLSDLNRVDFRNVQEQASWVCRCDPMLVEQIEKDFKSTLSKQKSLEQWAQWLEAVVDQVLASCHDKPMAEVATLAKQFLLKWSFYSSMIIRDLTLRSAASFGSFHLIRLLYDEYMFYLVEQRLAKSVDQTSIAIMAQSGQFLMDQGGFGFSLDSALDSSAGVFATQIGAFEDQTPNTHPLSHQQRPAPSSRSADLDLTLNQAGPDSNIHTPDTPHTQLFLNGDGTVTSSSGAANFSANENEAENAEPGSGKRGVAKLDGGPETKQMKLGPASN